MNNQLWSMTDPILPLKVLSLHLGKKDFDWAVIEQRWLIDCEFDDIGQHILSNLTPEPFNACFYAYGDSLAVSGFYTGDMEELDCKGHITQHELDELAKIVGKDETLIFRFKLDKHKLLECWFGKEAPHATRYLYLFDDAFIRFLQTCALADLEKLWGNAPTNKVLIFLPNYKFTHNGLLLAVLGKYDAQDWSLFIPDSPFDLKQIDPIIEIRKKYSAWEKPWVNFLTPLHLQTGYKPESKISILLSSHWMNAIILYTAGRVTGQNAPLIATYAGAQQSVQVDFINLKDACLDIEDEKRLQHMHEIWAWAYDPAFALDRLPFVQIVIAQYLRAAEKEIRCNLLLHNAQEVLNGLKWHWQAFIEKKIEGYTEQVRELEVYVDKVMDAYSGQISALIGSLTETALAAVAAVLGTFIASLFSGKINITVFACGMILYAVYVYVFPFRFKFMHQKERFTVTSESFVKRRAEFERFLYKTRVDEIVGDRVSKSQARFESWAKRVKTTYTIVIILAISASFVAVSFGILSFFLTKLFSIG